MLESGASDDVVKPVQRYMVLDKLRKAKKPLAKRSTRRLL